MYTTWKGSMAIATPTSVGWSWPLTFRHRTWEWLAIAICGLRKRCMLIGCINSRIKEPSWWCQPICKNMLVKLDHFPQVDRGEKRKNLWCFTTFSEKVGRKTTIPSSYFIHPHQIHPHLSWALPLHQLKRVRCAHPMRMWPHPSNIPTLMARHGCNITHGSESWFFVQELEIHIVRFVQSLCSKRMRNL